MKRQTIVDALNDDDLVIFLEGPEFDAAIVGTIERFGMPTIVCYDYARVLSILVRQGMSYEDAVEWYDFNIIGAWMGEETPCFLHRVTK